MKTDNEYRAIFEQAFAAAKKAEVAYWAKHGEPTYCGFAWVLFPDGRDPAVRAYKRIYAGDQLRLGHQGHPTGWCVWNPGGSSTQSMDIKEAGARAFADVLGLHGIKAYMQSRAD